MDKMLGLIALIAWVATTVSTFVYKIRSNMIYKKYSFYKQESDVNLLQDLIFGKGKNNENFKKFIKKDKIYIFFKYLSFFSFFVVMTVVVFSKLK